MVRLGRPKIGRVPVCIKLKPYVNEALEEMAKSEGFNKSYFIEQLIIEKSEGKGVKTGVSNSQF